MSKTDIHREMLGQRVRDSWTGLVGRVIGITHWEVGHTVYIVQPQANQDGTVPPTAYVQSVAAVVLPDPFPANRQQ